MFLVQTIRLIVAQAAMVESDGGNMKILDIRTVELEGSVEHGKYYALEARTELPDGSVFPVTLKIPEQQYYRLMYELVDEDDYQEKPGLTQGMKQFFDAFAR